MIFDPDGEGLVGVTVDLGFQLKVQSTLDISLYIFSNEFRRVAP